MLFPYAFTLSTLGHIEVHEKYLKSIQKVLGKYTNSSPLLIH